MTGFIAIRAPHVPYGPVGVPQWQADADYIRSAARNIDQGREAGGHNVTATVVGLLHSVADALLAARLPSDEELRVHAIRQAERLAQPGMSEHREGWCRPGDDASGPWALAPGALETQQCQTCGRQVGK